MSFSAGVKNELSETILKDCSKRQQSVFLYGILYGMRNGAVNVENSALAGFLEKSLKADSFTMKKTVTKENVRYRFSVTDAQTLPQTDKIEHYYVDGSDEEAGLFLRGVFISCGTVTDPEKQYHLELSPETEGKCKAVMNLIFEHGMEIRLSARRDKSFLYTKDSEYMTDFLTYIGATNHAMEIMNAKIVKELRNNINRSVNCEDANIGKIVNAGERQAEDIRYIMEMKGLLSDDLAAVAKIRLENTDISLREIGQMLEPKISRSGVNHRMQRIAAIAKALRGE